MAESIAQVIGGLRSAPRTCAGIALIQPSPSLLALSALSGCRRVGGGSVYSTRHVSQAVPESAACNRHGVSLEVGVNKGARVTLSRHRRFEQRPLRSDLFIKPSVRRCSRISLMPTHRVLRSAPPRLEAQ